jgi:hypothetical protein
MSQRRDAKLLQVLVRQARENRLVYVILAEDRLILSEAQAPQQTTTSMLPSVTEGCPASWSCPEGVSSWGATQPDIHFLGARRPAGSTAICRCERGVEPLSFDRVWLTG